MSTKAQPHQPKPARTPNHPLYINDGLTPKKTALIIVTVIGCIAILWPKVFHPMLFGQPPQKAAFKDHRGPGGVRCCDVVLDREKFMNATPPEFGPQLYRKGLNLYTGEISLRQERPAHLHPESIYQAMKERGRAIPPTQTVPIVERKTSASNPPPRIVEGRPGPIPGMRPPMGAGALHQPQQKGNSMGFIMPLYTIGIIVFFGYTIMKLVFKKPVVNAPYGPAPTDPNFRKEVFGQENGRHVEDLNGSKLVVTAIQGLIDAADEELNLRENKPTSEENKKKSENSTLNNVDNISFEHTTTSSKKSDEHNDLPNDVKNSTEALKTESKVEEIKENGDASTGVDNANIEKAKLTDLDRSITVVGLEISASCEGGKKWTGRPPTPVFISHNEHSKNEEDFPEPQSIYLEGSLPHESKILVSDAEIKQEEVYDAELNGSEEEPAVVLSSKMTLSLINLDANNENLSPEVESPLADDIEIIGHEEQEIDSN